MTEEKTHPTDSSSPLPTGAALIALTPELVREVAGKVYALWLHDLRIEQERIRYHIVTTERTGGTPYGRW